MPLAQAGALRVFRFDSFPENEISHGVLSRKGGISPPPWESLNVGGNLGDAPERVAENRQRAFNALALDLSQAFDVWQVHSATILPVTRPRRGEPLIQADGMVTDRPGLTLFMRFADCVPILAYDPRRRAVGIAHAGWLGTVRQTARALVRAMVDSFGTRPEDLVTGLGPSIAAHHYPVGADVVDQILASMGPRAEAHVLREDGRTHLDLWSANRWQLEQEGVGHIELSGLCTACDLDHWYSHRGEHGRTGRLGAVISLHA